MASKKRTQQNEDNKPKKEFGTPLITRSSADSGLARMRSVAASAKSVRAVEQGSADVVAPVKEDVVVSNTKEKVQSDNNQTRDNTKGGKTKGGKTKGGKGGGKGGQETPAVTADSWKQIIQEEFGSFWDVYNESPDVRKVLDDAVKGGYHNDEVKVTAALSNTNWFRSTQASARQFAIRQSTDPATLQAQIDKNAATIKDAALQTGIVLADSTILRLASDAIKFGWSDNQLTNAVGSEVVATAKTGGPSAFAELSRGSTGRRLREIADSYAIKPSDSMIQEWTAKVMSGEQSEETFTNTVREQARTMYRSLAPQIDKNMDVKTATSAYTSQASRVLGIDATQIDWTDAKWNKALNYQDPKTNEYRAMDTWEWDRYLRSLPEWQNTDDAKNLYRTAAFTLAQAFGRTT